MGLCIWISRTEFSKATELESFILGFGVAFRVVLLIMGLIGWIIVKCKNRCLVCLFLVFMLLVTIAFLAVWAIGQVVQSNLSITL